MTRFENPLLFDTTDVPELIVDLWRKGDKVWDDKMNEPAFESYASADYGAVFHALKSLKGQATKFVEFGSGLGIVTMMAAHHGFEAYGIEAKEPLVDLAEEYALQYAPQAKFAAGSFFPEDFQWNPGAGDESVRTFIDEPSAYPEMDMELSDFDLIYAYPWPTEHELYNNLVNNFAATGTLYLTYDAREGINVRRIA